MIMETVGGITFTRICSTTDRLTGELMKENIYQEPNHNTKLKTYNL